MKSGMNVFFAASECAPYAKTGGLADVVGSLPRELACLGNQVSVIIPLFRTVKKYCSDLKETGIRLEIALGDVHLNATVCKHTESGVDYYFIRNDKFYDREFLYGTPEKDYEDNAARFIFFSKAVLFLISRLGKPADIIHCHDWQTGILPALMRYGWNTLPNLQKAKTIFTIHNLGYQGKFWYYDLKMTGLPDACFTPEGLEYYGDINMIKSGIVYSDIITTVSRKYAEEIQTTEFGCGLEGVLAKRKNKLYGILNGVDYDVWSPEKDKFIVRNYSIKVISGKKECRKDLLKTFQLNASDKTPVIGAISRLAEQKGFDLIAKIMKRMLKLGTVFVLLGAGDKKYNELFEKIGKENPKNTGIKIAFSEELAHKIEAGSDIFLMPSRYEPCGLNQMYSLKYGTIPVVRATGGLDDTIKNYSPKTGRGNGFKFKASSAEALLKTVKKAVDLFKDSFNWNRLIKNAMSEDYSWSASAKKYIQLYKTALKNS